MSIRTFALVALTFGSLATAACGGGDSTGPSGATGFSITNGSNREAWYIYSRACGNQSWGDDELGTANILMPGESVSWGEAAGCYDLLALTSAGDAPRFEARYDGKTVSAGAATAVTIADGDWAEVSDPAAVASLGRGATPPAAAMARTPPAPGRSPRTSPGPTRSPASAPSAI